MRQKIYMQHSYTKLVVELKALLGCWAYDFRLLNAFAGNNEKLYILYSVSGKKVCNVYTNKVYAPHSYKLEIDYNHFQGASL